MFCFDRLFCPIRRQRDMAPPVVFRLCKNPVRACIVWSSLESRAEAETLQFVGPQCMCLCSHDENPSCPVPRLTHRRPVTDKTGKLTSILGSS